MGSILERFWRKVDESAGPNACWPWTAYLDRDGYGQFGLHGSMRVRSHRFAYELLVGPIPPGLHIDHLCRNRACCNPAHLEPVTPRENTMRSPLALSALNARKTHCKRGHEFTPRNTLVRKHSHRPWERMCRTCNREQAQRTREARRKAA